MVEDEGAVEVGVSAIRAAGVAIGETGVGGRGFWILQDARNRVMRGM